MGSYNQHFDISDSAVEAYYGWDIDDNTPCASCGHPLNEHDDKNKKCINKYGCECQEWLECEYENHY